MNIAPRVNSDYVSDVLDEIALEGLDGITIEALWKRLSVRPNFAFKIDDHSKVFLWKVLTELKNVSFYEIPIERATLSYYDHSITDNSKDASLELDEVYPYCKITSTTGEYGSCQHYTTRVDVTVEVIVMDLNRVEEKWGNKLVVVASQEVRMSTLLGQFGVPHVDVTKCAMHYDMLERIGRSRYLGLNTCGRGSLQAVVEDPKSIFHYLKYLQRHKLIKKQALLGNFWGSQNSSKVHLSRFFEQCISDNLAILQIAIKELKTRPKCAMTCDEFNLLFDARKRSRLKKFKKTTFFKKYISLSNVLPYRTFFPDASQSEWEKKTKTGERMIRCVQLCDPNIELNDIEKDCDIEEEDSAPGVITKGIYYENMPIVSQAYLHIKNSGASGLTQFELSSIMGLNRSFVRGLINRLLNEKLCQYYIENNGRQRSKRYMVGENVKTKAAATELVQILSETSGPAKPPESESCQINPEDSKMNVTMEKSVLPQIQEENMSYRGLRRVGMIIRILKAHRFRFFHQIMKCIVEEEIKEGVTTRVDRATIHRLLKKLAKDELIKIIVLSGDDKTGPKIKLYAEPTFELDEKQMSSIFQNQNTSYVDGEFTKFGGDESLVNVESEFSSVLLENLIEVKRMFNGIVQIPDKIGQTSVSESELVYSPKFIRLNILHDLIFHLVYDYTGILNATQEDLIGELSKTTVMDEDLKREIPKLYGNQLSTYMFVPPLSNSGKNPGWCLISDVLLRMPLSIIVKVLRVTDPCPELWRYLNHPIRKHILVKDLPLSVRKVFFGRKFQLGSLYYDLRRLCYIGVLQFGARFGREHYQTLIYLNRRASLLDTSTSPAEYHQVPADKVFDVKSYYFETKADVKKYWMDMFNICMGTNLGARSSLDGKKISAERELSKESLRKILEPKTMAQVHEDDNGSLPGDKLGAAGLDSIMFSFLRSNWTGSVKKPKEELKRKKMIKIPVPKIRKEQVKKLLLLKKTRRKKGGFKGETSIPDLKLKGGKLRKLKERESKLKRRRSIPYDDVDLEALKLMNTLRVTWSTAEDNFLLICRVAMIFLCPNTRTFNRIPWVEVRRVLQENFPESRNKTQRAIARRIIYMLRNPTTVRSVNLCLEELREMPEATTRFDCTDLQNRIKPSAPNLAELQKRLYEKFYDLVFFLKDRFIDNTNFNVKKRDRDLIPDTMSEFYEKFQFDVHVDNLTVKNVRENVVRAILMSSLSARADKTSAAVQLFDIYRQYNDDELQNAIKKLQQDKVITVSKKTGNTIFRNGKILPLSFTPYKLSFAFQHMLTTKFEHTIYTESFTQINSLLQRNENEEFVVDLNECNLALFLLASKNLVSFRTLIPEQIMILDSGKLSDATYSNMLERYCEMLRYSGSNKKVVCTSGKIIRSESGDAEMDEESDRKRPRESEPTDLTSAKKPRYDEDEDDEEEQQMQQQELQYVDPLLDSGFSGKKENFDEDESEEGAEKDKESLGEGIKPYLTTGQMDKKQLNDRATKISRVILYMIREETKNDGKNDSGKMAQEFCVVNASKIMSRFDKVELERCLKNLDPKAVTAFTKSIISRSLVPLNLVDENSVLSDLMRDDPDMDQSRQVLEFITSRGELGATVSDLRSNCDCPNLSKIVRELTRVKVIIKSGIEETTFVSQKYSTPWLLNSFKMTRLEREKVKPNEIAGVALDTATDEDPAEDGSRRKVKGVISLEEIKGEGYTPPACSTDVNNKIKIIIRPWIRIDGSLNRKVLDRFLGTVLAFIMINPGTTVKAVMNNFAPFITPIWTKDLVDILHEIGCVEMRSLIVVQTASLFTKSVVHVSDEYTGLEEDDSVTIEAKIDAITTLGLFIGKKAYSKDFLVD